jgi:hypothetical protein
MYMEELSETYVKKIGNGNEPILEPHAKKISTN